MEDFMKKRISDYFKREKLILTGKIKPTKEDYDKAYCIGIIYVVFAAIIFAYIIPNVIFSLFEVNAFIYIVTMALSITAISFPFLLWLCYHDSSINL